jgi:hypothetical protein
MPTGRERNRQVLFSNPEVEGCTVLGIALVFPVSRDPDAAVSYLVGSVGQLES